MIVTPKTHSWSSSHAFAIAGNTLILCWFGEVTVATVAKAREAHVEAARSGQRLYVLAFAEGDTKLPSPEVRDASAEIDKLGAADVEAHATVLPGEGFWVAAARSVVGAVFFLSRSQYPRRVFAKLEGAQAWLAQHGANADAQSLIAYVERERATRLVPPSARAGSQ
jgi:hypothetical protein